MIATTLPIKLSDVCLELYGSSSTVGRSLSQAFTDATGTFDTTYENINGYRNSLQNFRGYSQGPYMAYMVATATQTSDNGGPDANQWVNLNNATANNNLFASSNIALGSLLNITDDLSFNNCGFSIPTGATITGIKVDFKAKRSSASVTVRDDQFLLRKNYILTGDSKATSVDWGTTSQIRTYGGNTDLWGTTWTPAEVNNIGFGFNARGWRNTGTANVTCYVDYVGIYIYYTL